MSGPVPSPRAAIARGVLAGVIGTAAMTAWQELAAKLQDSEEPEAQDEQPHDPWEQAPAPAQVARRISEGGFHHSISSDRIPLLTNVMHWAYGTGWGVLYGLAVAGRPRGAATAGRGAFFGAAVWASSYVQLVPMGIYELSWKYKPKELALDLSYHLAYGLGTAMAFSAAERLD
jgi:hypothetical protein